MHKKPQEMWDSYHEIPREAYVPEGTVLVQLEMGVDELTFYEAEVSHPWMGAPQSAPVRSMEPLLDPNDTGILTVRSKDGFVLLVDTYEDHGYDLTKSQARNLVRKLMEAVDE